MQIPETPRAVSNLDLMLRLDAYAAGTASWYENERPLGEEARQACRTLHTGLIGLIERALAPLLDRISAREMETFTMHDRMHGNKVAHLMWHILEEDRRRRLTPAEIGLLVGAAFLHDVGMALSPSEREARLDPESDLWERLEIDETHKAGIEQLRTRITDSTITDTQRRRAEQLLAQAQEVLLAQDTRERHATPERYRAVLNSLECFAEEDPENVPNVKSVFSFDGDSFLAKLIQICVSHNQDAEALVERDEEDFALPRFPRDYPVGCCVADLHMTAAALRLADILDFDRERTPSVLFHYLLPGALTAAAENRSVLEWGKHLTISSWNIDTEAVVFRGRSRSHVIHHAVVQFADAIEKEIDATRATFGALGDKQWPFALPLTVLAQIIPEGYRYVPYRFELDDDRVYNLLMGGAIYDNSLVAIRELIQNAVDACKLRDALTQLYEPVMTPGTDRRIVLTYIDPDDQSPYPRLSVADSGTGMDAWIIERFFLKVGRSFYRSSEFNRTRLQLRRGGLDFAPVSEFGIGFLSSFLIADQVTVETAMWDSIRGDTRKRTLTIDGPTRLIRLHEQDNTGPGRFRGTKVTLVMTRGNADVAPSYTSLISYVRAVCRDLPYPLVIERRKGIDIETETLMPRGMSVRLTPEERDRAIVISVNQDMICGEITILPTDRRPISFEGDQRRKIVIRDHTDVVDTDDDEELWFAGRSKLSRGGFLVGDFPGLPEWSMNYPPDRIESRGVVAIKPNPRTRRLSSTNVARNSAIDTQPIEIDVIRSWLGHMIRNPAAFPPEIIWRLDAPRRNFRVMPEVIKFLHEFELVELYRFVRSGWVYLRHASWLTAWEQGRLEVIPLRGIYLRMKELRTEDLLQARFRWAGEFMRQLSNYILPQMCGLVITARSYYASTPIRGWQESQKGNSLEYFAQGERGAWPIFVTYRGKIADVLGFQTNRYLDHLNDRYADRFGCFASKELEIIPTLLDQLIDVVQLDREVVWTPAQWTLVERVSEIAGDLLIGSPRGLYTITSLVDRARAELAPSQHVPNQ